MRKNGFTLVELIVAISIMSIILIVAIPSISSLQQRNAKKRYENYGETLITSGKLYTDSNSIDMFGYESDGCYDISFEKMKDKKLAKDIDYKDVTCADNTTKKTFVRVKKLDGEYKYQLSIRCIDEKGTTVYEDLITNAEAICAGEKSREGPAVSVTPKKTDGFSNDKNYKVTVKVEDLDGLLENNSVEYAWCKTANCSDVTSYTKIDYHNKREDKKASRKVNKPAADGTYYFRVKSVQTVDVFNNASNVDQIYGPYKFDTTPPSCESSGGSDTWINASSNPGYRRITGKCSDSFSGCKEATVYKDFLTDINDKLSPGKVYDNAGNSADCPKQTVKVDKTKPTCESSGGSDTWINASSNPGYRRITGKCSDGLSGCRQSTIYTDYSTDMNGKAGAGTVYDNAGNSAVCPATQTVKIDKTAPTCTNHAGFGSWTKETRTVWKGCSDSNSGCRKKGGGTGGTTEQYGTHDITSTKENYTFETYTIYDNAGNARTCSGATIKVYVDKTAPKCTHQASYTTWTNSARSVWKGCEDAHSGCRRKGGGTGGRTEQYGSNTVSSSRKAYSFDGYTIYDNVGNSKYCSGATINVLVDTNPPACSYTNKKAGKKGISFTIECTDSGGSGIATCSSNNFSGGDYHTAKKSEIKVSKNYTVKDRAGNSNSCWININHGPNATYCGTEKCNPYNCNPYTCNGPYHAGWSTAVGGGNNAKCPTSQCGAGGGYCKGNGQSGLTLYCNGYYEKATCYHTCYQQCASTCYYP